MIQKAITKTILEVPLRLDHKCNYKQPSLRFGLQLYVPLFMLKFEYFDIEYWDLFVIWNFLTLHGTKTS